MAIKFTFTARGREYTGHISTDNSKTGIWSINFLAGDETREYSGYRPTARKDEKMPCGTCPTDCPGCYAKKITRNNEPLDNYIDNTIAVLEAPREFVAALEKALYNGVLIPGLFRLHTSGEFASYAYFTAIMEMIARHPETRYGAYTKRAEFVNRYGIDNIPDNLTLSCSPWPGVSDPIGDLPQFCYDDGSIPEYAELPHCPAVDKNGKKTGIMCYQCKHCYNAKRGDRWAVYAH